MRILILRLEAPLMSFGGTMVDKWGTTEEFPAASMLTGLFANALGYDQREFDAHQRLQARLRFAVRVEQPGRRLVDYQTVDLGQALFTDTGWTTRGEREDRRGGSASSGTHIRLRPYWAGRCCILACTLTPEGEAPTVETLAEALRRPARPLFLGRKPCLPSGPLLTDVVEAPGVLAALRAHPCTESDGVGAGVTGFRAQWPEGEADGDGELRMISDERDWQNQFHSGTRPVRRGKLTLTKEAP